jgi:hypothetical protein
MLQKEKTKALTLLIKFTKVYIFLEFILLLVEREMKKWMKNIAVCIERIYRSENKKKSGCK